MYSYFKTEKGQFVVPIWGIVEPIVADRLPSQADQLVIKNQPYKKIKVWFKEIEGYGVLDLAVASNSLKNDMLCMTEKDIRNMIENTELIGILKKKEHPSYKKIMQVKKHLKNGTWSVHEFDPLADFAQKQCVALFCTLKNGTEGYIQKNGALGTLSKALLFENSRDAESSIKRQTSLFYQYDSLQVVNLNVSVGGLGPRIQNQYSHETTDFSNTSILGVDALAQKQKIKDALQCASLDQLAEAYKNLTGEAWGKDATERPKKRM